MEIQKGIDVLPKSFLDKVATKSSVDHKVKHFALPSDCMTAIHCARALGGFRNTSAVIEKLVRVHLMGGLRMSGGEMSNGHISVKPSNLRYDKRPPEAR